MAVQIQSISYALPDATLSNQSIAALNPDWPVDKIAGKTGIHLRHISGDDEYSLELAIAAGRRLLDEHNIAPEAVDFILFCSQTPKFLIPTSACLVQHALGLPTRSGALDVNQGCSGYVSCLMLAEGLVDSGRAKGVLLITADTYTKLVAPEDRSLKTIMGDAATASFIRRADQGIGVRDFEFGTDGTGAEAITAYTSGLHGLTSGGAYQPDFRMNGPGVFNFVLTKVPEVIDDLFVFHQANAHMLESVRIKMGIAPERFFVSLADTGNTGASSIPLALGDAVRQGRVMRGDKVVLIGFGAGLSWSACLIDW